MMENMITLIMNLGMIPLIAILGIILGLFYKGIDRIIAAKMQARVGPPITQPYRDIRKLMMKENIIPKNAVKWIFNLMPVVSLTFSILILMYLPIGGFGPILEGHGDLLVILYLLIIPSLALVIGGFSSSSPYATVGAQREMVTMLSYEFPLAITICSIAWLLSVTSPGLIVFSLSVIIANPAWTLVGPLGFIGLLMLLVIMIFVMPGKLGLAPFDVAEAETELAGGVLVEYSGRNLALFHLSNAVQTFALASILIAIFIPWGISGIMGLTGFVAGIADFIFFLFKVLVVVFFGSSLIRVAVARLRISQVVKTYWGYATILSILALILIWIDQILFSSGVY